MDAAGQRMEVSRVVRRKPGRAVRLRPQGRHDPGRAPGEGGAAGGKVVAVIDFTVDLPEKWGRWGNHQGITYLLNWYPVLAHHDDRGWERTPFVPWHQPWHQEAGHYTVVVDLPAGQVVASSGRITGARTGLAGWQRLTIEASPARDFALVCSDRFQTWERQAGIDHGPGPRLPRARRQRPACPRLRLRGHPALREVVRALLRHRVRDRPLVLRLERQRVLGPGPARRPGDEAAHGRPAVHRPPGHPRDLPPVVVEHRRHQWICRDVHGRGAGQLLHRAAARRQVRPQRPADHLARGADLAAHDRPRGSAAGRLLRLAAQGGHRADHPGPGDDGQPQHPVQPGLRPRRQGRRDDPQPPGRRAVLRLLPPALHRLCLQDPALRRLQARAHRLRSARETGRRSSTAGSRSTARPTGPSSRSRSGRPRRPTRTSGR